MTCKQCCGHCGEFSQQLFSDCEWWCPHCGSLGTKHTGGSVSWRAPAARPTTHEIEAVEINGKRFVAEGLKQ